MQFQAISKKIGKIESKICYKWFEKVEKIEKNWGKLIEIDENWWKLGKIGWNWWKLREGENFKPFILQGKFRDLEIKR